MKNIALVICMMLASLPLLAQDSIFIHPDVGYSVDPIENEYYRIATGYSFNKFKLARLYKAADNMYLQVLYGNKAASIPKTESQLASMRKAIELKGPITGNRVYVEVAESREYNGLLQAINDSTITVSLDSTNTVELVRQEISDFEIYSEKAPKLTASVNLTMSYMPSISIDLPLLRKEKFNLFFSLSGGTVLVDPGFPIFRASLPMLFGSNGRYFEFSPGVLSIVWFVLPTVSLGYRYQPTDKKIVFRAGGGFPDYIYVGLGFQLGR